MPEPTSNESNVNEPMSNEPAEPEASEDTPAGHEFSFGHTFRFTRQAPVDALPPETIARLRAGGEITPEELAAVRAAALEGSGLLGKIVGAMASHADASSTTTAEDLADLGAEPDAVVIPGGARSFTFEWRHQPKDPEREPATYYELLTGEPDPARDFFVTARRVMNLIVLVITLGVPLALIILAIATGQSAQTVVVIGIAALLIGAMMRRSFPRTPFD